MLCHSRQSSVHTPCSLARILLSVWYRHSSAARSSFEICCTCPKIWSVHVQLSSCMSNQAVFVLLGSYFSCYSGAGFCGRFFQQSWTVAALNRLPHLPTSASRSLSKVVPTVYSHYHNVFTNLLADLAAAGLQYVADVSDDWSRVSMQVQRSLVHPVTASLSDAQHALSKCRYRMQTVEFTLFCE